MECWVDLNSGTYGTGDGIVFIYLSSEEEEVFAELSDNERAQIASFMVGDNDFEAARTALGI